MEEELKEAFKVFDKDQNGYISPSEVSSYLLHLQCLDFALNVVQMHFFNPSKDIENLACALKH